MFKVFADELKKLLKLQHILLVFLLAITARIVLCIIPMAHEHPYSDEVYKRYTTQLSGELTNEKNEFLNARLVEIQALIADYDSMQQKYRNGEIDLDEFADFTSRHGIAEAEEKTVAYLCEKYAKLSECSGFDGQIFCDTDWADLFTENGCDYIMLLALLCIAVPAFDIEFSSGSYAQILTSKRGRQQTAIAKLTAVVFAVFVLTLLMSAARLGVFAYQHGLAHSDKAAGNLLLNDALGDKTLLGYFVTDALLKALAFVFYALAACTISVACKNVTFSIAISFIFCVTALFLSQDNDSILLAATVLGKMYPPDIQVQSFVLLLVLKSLMLGAATVFLWSRRRSS